MHSNLWAVDSGASSHFFAVREDFISFHSSNTGKVSGLSTRVRGHGTCKLTLVDLAGRKCTVTLNGVLYDPDLALRSNGNYLRLSSVRVAASRGYMFEFTQSSDKLWTPEGSVFEMVRSKEIVWLPTIKPYVVLVSTTLLSKHHTIYETMHRRCCHVSDETIRKISTLGITGIHANCTHAWVTSVLQSL